MPKRDLTDIFRPYEKPPSPSSLIPAKRPSPSANEQASTSSLPADKQEKQNGPQTPPKRQGTGSRKVSSYQSPVTPASGTPVTIAIRTPKPYYASQSSAKSFTPQPLDPIKKPIFTSTRKYPKEYRKAPFFTDIRAASQKVIAGGTGVAIKSSDDEDSDSLCSLDEILGRNRSDPSNGSPSSSDKAEEYLEAERARSLSLFTNGRSNAIVGREKLRALTSKANGLDFDINLLVGEHFDDEETEASVNKTRQRYQNYNEDQLRRQGLVDRELLASVVDGEEDGAGLQRLVAAVERTEALATQATWSMFNVEPLAADRDPSRTPPDEVKLHVSETVSSEDGTPTEGAYLSGSVAAGVAIGALPDKVLSLTVNRILKETRDDVRRSCTRVVKAASQQWTSGHLTETRIARLFCQLGADTSKVKCRGILRPEPRWSTPSYASRKEALLSTIDILLGLSAKLDPAALWKFVQLLMRLAIDSNLMADGRICIAVEDIISNLLGHGEELVSRAAATCILQDMGNSLQDPFLQTQSLKHILPTSRQAASLRIRLATQFLLGGTVDKIPQDLNLSTPAEINLDQLTAHIANDPRFDVSPTKRDDSFLDYTMLSSLVYILDAAIADGGRPRNDPSASASASTSTTGEQGFNHRVDRLADRVKSIHTSIADTGASHLRRTETKEALNALHFRLLYGVRTKPRPKKSVFGGDGRMLNGGDRHGVDEQYRSANVMQQFLRQSRLQKEKEGDGDG